MSAHRQAKVGRFRFYLDVLHGPAWRMRPKVTLTRRPWGFGAGVRLLGTLWTVNWLRGH